MRYKHNTQRQHETGRQRWTEEDREKKKNGEREREISETGTENSGKRLRIIEIFWRYERTVRIAFKNSSFKRNHKKMLHYYIINVRFRTF